MIINTPIQFGRLIVDRQQIKDALGDEKAQLVQNDLEAMKQPHFDSPSIEGMLDDLGVDLVFQIKNYADGDAYLAVDIQQGDKIQTPTDTFYKGISPQYIIEGKVLGITKNLIQEWLEEFKSKLERMSQDLPYLGRTGYR